MHLLLLKIAIGEEYWVLTLRPIRPLVGTLAFLIEEGCEEPVNDMRVLFEVALVVLSLEFDCFDVAKSELVRIVLLTPLKHLFTLSHIHVLQVV